MKKFTVLLLFVLFFGFVQDSFSQKMKVGAPDWTGNTNWWFIGYRRYGIWL